jgi:lysophospholipase L1-like esterase
MHAFMKQANLSKVLLVSLVLNAIAIALVARSVYFRGGWEYVRTRFEGAPADKSINPDMANYAHRQTLFESLPKRTGRIVFVGDSLTQGCEWNEFYPGVLNRGIGGDTSAGLLKRIGAITEMKPRVIFLMIGSNDLYNLGLGPEQTLANIRATVAEIRRSSPQTMIYLESNTPTWSVRLNAHSRAVNQGLRAMADGKSVFYIDLYPSFIKADVLNSGFTSDGGHLNGPGYMVWKRLIDPYVQQYRASAENEEVD